jgi:hypothetical protein
MDGWIKLYRKLLEKPIWKLSTPEQKSILITILCLVNHEGEEWEWKGQKYNCQPGQKITSLQKIASASGKGVSVQNVRTALERFQKLDFLTNESTKESRLVTVLNWELYQSAENNQQSNQQTGNKGVTTNKNDKNDKKKDIYNFSPPLFDEVKTYCLERNKGVNPDKWYDHYTSNGWMVGKTKMKDWKAAVRTWEPDEKPKEQSKYRDLSNYKPGD